MDNLMVDKFANNLKELVKVKRELMAKRAAITESIRGGEAYFSKRLTGAPSKELDSGAKRMCQLISEYDKITKEIDDIDLILISSVETYTGNFVVKIKTSHKMNDAGDVCEAADIMLTPFILDTDMIQVTPEDIWFLKMVKEAYKPSNVSFVKKDEFKV